MTPAALTGYVAVRLFGVLMCTAPAVTRPTLQFGVRVPPTHTGAAIIRREKRAYYWRSAAVAACCGGGGLLRRHSDHLLGIRVAVAAQDNPAPGGSRGRGLHLAGAQEDRRRQDGGRLVRRSPANSGRRHQLPSCRLRPACSS